MLDRGHRPDHLEDTVPDAPAPALSPWLTKAEAAAHLRVSPRQIDRHVAAQRLTRHVVEGTSSVRFRRTELDALVTPAGEPDGPAGRTLGTD